MENSKKISQLKYHKRLATGLFLLMILTYILSIIALKYDWGNWFQYVKAFSEAAMVGALADWFAVTALFHHPLGLKIPHTNLIEHSKQSIGNNLGQFVVDNFITSKTIKPYILSLSLSNILSQFIGQKDNATKITVFIKDIIKDVFKHLEDEKIIQFLEQKVNEAILSLPLHQFSAQGIEFLLNKKEHQPLITSIAANVKEYIKAYQPEVEDRVTKESYFFIPKFVDKKLAEKITDGLISFFNELENDENHRIRIEIELKLRDFINELKGSEKWKTYFDQLKVNLTESEKWRHYLTQIWFNIKSNALNDLDQPNSKTALYIHEAITNFGNKLSTDPVLKDNMDRIVRQIVYKNILKYRQEVGNVISNTVGNWEGKDLSEKLELEVGKDLQFIRINGTLVGGLVGLIIYVVTQLLA